MQFFTNSDVKSSQLPPQPRRVSTVEPSQLPPQPRRVSTVEPRSLFASAADLNSSAESSHHLVDNQDQIMPDWKLEDAQYSPLMVVASLKSIPAWLKACRPDAPPLDNDDWIFNSDMSGPSRYYLSKLTNDPTYGALIDRLLRTQSNVFAYHNGGKMLSVKVSDSAEQIQEQLRQERWPITFNADEVSDYQTENPLISATRLNINCPGWEGYGLNMIKKRSGFGNGDFLSLPRGSKTEMMMDSFQHPVVEYCLDHEATHLKVRLTDITKGSVPDLSMDHLLSSHQQGDFTHYFPSEYKGVTFPSIKLALGNQVMERLLGATNRTHQFIAAQASGQLLITCDQALFVDLASVALDVERCISPPIPSDYYNFYHLIDGRLVFTMLVEVLVDDQVILSCAANEDDHRQSNTR